MTREEQQVVLGLVEEGFRLRHTDAKAMLACATLALEMVLARVCEHSPDLADLRGLCSAHVGNARRILGMFPEARADFVRASDFLASGSGRRDYLATLRRFQASLEESLRDYGAALRCLREAAELSATDGDAAGLASCRVKIAIVLVYAGQPETAFRELMEAIPEISDEDLLRTAHQVAIRALCDSGEPQHALLIQHFSERLLGRGGPLFRLKVLWLEGQIRLSLGSSEGRRLLAEAREGYRRRGMLQETALIALEEALAAARAGEPAQARVLVGIAAPVLESLGIGQDTLAARLILLEADRLEQAETALLGILREVRLRLAPTA